MDDYLVNASRWNLEQDYETKPRELGQRGKENARLPIKTADGRIQQMQAPLLRDEGTDSSSDEDDVEDVQKQRLDSSLHLSSEQKIITVKEELARIASLISENPEENAGGFKILREMAQSQNLTVKKLAMATQMAVFKDVTPGYRIRLMGKSEAGVKLSKEVKRLRTFEHAFLSSYQKYVQSDLTNYARLARGDNTEPTANLASVAISCACTLLLSAPHFNLRGDLIKIIANKLGGKSIDKDYVKCRSTLETLFRDDEAGDASLEAVTALARMIRGRNYTVDESVLNTFLHLRLLTELSLKGSNSAVDKPAIDGKLPKKKRVFRTKKQRKAIKEVKAVEKEFRETNAMASQEERERLQAETLKLVFGTYLHILKTRSPKLTGAVLEGLAKYAHLINQDFFGDLLEVLRELASRAVVSIDPSLAESFSSTTVDDSTHNEPVSADPTRTALLSVATAFALLSAQDASRLALDLSSFTSLLHGLLLPLSVHPELEMSHKTLRLPDPETFSSSSSSSATPALKVNVSTSAALLLRALSLALSPRTTPPTHLAAFTHRLLTVALHAPERSATAVLDLLQQLARTQGRKISGLWSSEARQGDGAFDSLAGIEASKPFTETVWEGELLRLHYAEGVRDGLGGLEEIVAGMAG